MEMERNCTKMERKRKRNGTVRKWKGMKLYENEMKMEMKLYENGEEKEKEWNEKGTILSSQICE